MTTPMRIRLRRTKGWRKPADTIVVARGGIFGNPFKVGIEATDRAHAVSMHRSWLTDPTYEPFGSTSYRAELARRRDTVLGRAPLLRGHDLACWCPLDQPCHADTLLELANQVAP